MTEKPVSNQPTFSWLASWRIYLEAASLRMLFLGFAAGLPLLLVLGTLSFRLREAGIDRSTIWLPQLGGAGLWLQVGVGAAGRPHAHSLAHTFFRPQTQLALASAGHGHAGLGGHGPE